MINSEWLNSDDIDELQKKYPNAYNFLIRRQLAREYRYLLLHPIDTLNDWQKRRLNELSHIADAIDTLL